MRTPPSSRYARLERERRFLLAAEPALPAPSRVLEIEDRYLHGTRLRVRVVREDGREPVYKLGQKIRPDPRRPSTVEHTTIYLDPAEHGALAALPGDHLAKRRTLLDGSGPTLAVDVFAGQLAGLVLAELDLGGGARPPDQLPVPWTVEVTDDERFTGGALARTSAAGLHRLLDGALPH